MAKGGPQVVPGAPGRRVTEAVRRACADWAAVDRGAGRPWLVAVSGGVDSVVLLHTLWLLQPWHGVALRVVHVHHGLRAAADEDARFVSELARAWGIPASVERVSVESIPSRERRGLEADARRVRRQAIRRAAKRFGAERVWLAHHADDQLETILLRLARGASLGGLGGIRPVADDGGLTWVRPLLGVERRDIEAYAEAHHLRHVEDETNRFTDPLRNYLRHEVIPRLRERQPRIAATVARAALGVQDEDAHLEAEGRRVFERCCTLEAGGATVDVAALAAEPVALQRRAIKILLYCLTSRGNPVLDWTFAHIESVRRLCVQGRPSAAVHLPGGWVVRRSYGQLHVEPQSHACPISDVSTFSPVEWRLADGAELCLPAAGRAEWRFVCRAWHGREGVHVAPWTLLLPQWPTVEVRPGRPGERIAPLGLTGTKKVQDVFVDAKVPRSLRAGWPRFAREGEILWLPGLSRARHGLLDPEAGPGWRIDTVRAPEAVRAFMPPG